MPVVAIFANNADEREAALDTLRGAGGHLTREHSNHSTSKNYQTNETNPNNSTHVDTIHSAKSR